MMQQITAAHLFMIRDAITNVLDVLFTGLNLLSIVARGSAMEMFRLRPTLKLTEGHTIRSLHGSGCNPGASGAPQILPASSIGH